MNKTNIKKNILPILCVLAMFACIVFLCPKAMQNDTFWSIKVGEKIVDEWTWKVDDLSMHDGLKYVAHHFYTDVIIYFVYIISGFDGLYVLEIVMACGLAFALYFLNKELSGSKKLAYCMTGLQTLLMAPYISVRAQMISYILFVIEILLLEKLRKQEKLKYYLWLIAIPLLLTNFHMGVAPFYFIILGVYGLECIKLKFLWIEPNTNPNTSKLKKLVLCGVIGVVLLFVNPYGLDGVLYPFKTIGNEFINSTIMEFQPFSMNNSMTVLQVAYIMLVMFIFMVSKAKVNLKDMLLIFGTLFMNFMAFRYTGLFIICSAVIAIYILDVIKRLKIDNIDRISFVVTSILMLTVVCMNIYSDDEYLTDIVAPVKAVEILKENMDENTILYNEYNWGAYLMLNDIKPFIDSRCDLYTSEYNEGITVAEDFNKISRLEDGYKEAMEKYNFNTYLVMTDGLTRIVLDADETLEIIYTDETATLYQKKK